jgi:hypothetical protein
LVGRLSAALVALEAARAFFFLPAAIAFLSSRRNTEESSMLLRALIKATSSCLNIAPSAGAHSSSVELSFLHRIFLDLW